MTGLAEPEADEPATGTARRLLATMWRIRAFDERYGPRVRAALGDSRGLGPGQEAVAAGVCGQVQPEEPVFAGDQPCAHALARGITMERLLAALPEPSAVPDPVGAPFELACGFAGTTGPRGAGLPAAVGVALADQIAGRCRPVVALFDEEAAGSGLLAETLALAGRWRLPIIFVCENGRFTELTPETPEGWGTLRVAELAAPHGVATAGVDGGDVAAVHDAAGGALLAARAGDGPFLLECLVRRPVKASAGAASRPGGADGTRGAPSAGDPLARLARQAAAAGWFGEAEVLAAAAAARSEAAAAVVQS